MDAQKLSTRLRECGCTVLLDEPMAAHTSFHIGGPADIFITVPTERIAAVMTICKEADVSVAVIGNGSNLLVSDHGIDGVVLRFAAEDIVFEEDHVSVGAGTSLRKLCLAAWEHGLSGLEFAYGIPGTVGGGVYMNAGAYGGELADVLMDVTALKEDGTTVQLSKEQLKLGYRHSIFMEEPLIILKATMCLKADSPETIRARMDDFLSRRKEKQPLEYPSGGSFFKRPLGHFAGALIESCGLKGLTVGGAQVSEKHAGFLINRGNATCDDVMELCRMVQEAVAQTHGVQLEREVQYIGR